MEYMICQDGKNEHLATCLSTGPTGTEAYKAEKKYRDEYQVVGSATQSNLYSVNAQIYGDALYETSSFYSGSNSWFSDSSSYFSSGSFVMSRGATSAYDTMAGLFCYAATNISATSGCAFRVVLIP